MYERLFECALIPCVGKSTGYAPRKRKEYVQISAGRLYGSNTPPRSRIQRFCRIGRSPGGESRPRAQVSTACHVRFHFWNPTPAPPLLRFRTFLTATCPPRAPMTSSHFSEKGHAPRGTRSASAHHTHTPRDATRFQKWNRTRQASRPHGHQDATDFLTSLSQSTGVTPHHLLLKNE